MATTNSTINWVKTKVGLKSANVLLPNISIPFERFEIEKTPYGGAMARIPSADNSLGSPASYEPLKPSPTCHCLSDHGGPTGLRYFFCGSIKACQDLAERILTGDFVSLREMVDFSPEKQS